MVALLAAKYKNMSKKNEVAPGEIVYCNLTVTDGKKEVELRKVVYKPRNGYYKNIRELKKYKLKSPVTVVSVEVIKRLGFELKIAEQNG